MSVYFMVAEEVGMVKIGHTRHVWTRLSQAQVNSPVLLKMVAEIRQGDVALERELHERFAADRVRGDWFRLSPAIQACIADHGPPPVKVDGRTIRWRNCREDAGLSLSTAAAALRAEEASRKVAA